MALFVDPNFPNGQVVEPSATWTTGKFPK